MTTQGTVHRQRGLGRRARSASLPGTDDPRIDYLGGLTTGYGNCPYEGTTGYFRILYSF